MWNMIKGLMYTPSNPQNEGGRKTFSERYWLRISPDRILGFKKHGNPEHGNYEESCM